MRLVPADKEPVITVKPYEPLYTRNPTKTALEKLEEEMQSLLKSDVPNDEKMLQYGQLFQRFRVLQDQIKTPVKPRSIETTTEDKSVKPDILTFVPKSFQHKAKLLLNHLERTPFAWNDNLELTQHGKAIKGTNVVDIVNDLLRKRKNNAAPFGWKDVMRSLKETNVPREAIGNDQRWELFSTPDNNTPVPPSSKKKKKAETPVMPRKKNKRWLTFDSL